MRLALMEEAVQSNICGGCKPHFMTGQNKVCPAGTGKIEKLNTL